MYILDYITAAAPWVTASWEHLQHSQNTDKYPFTIFIFVCTAASHFFLFRQNNNPLVEDNTHFDFARNTHSFQVTVRYVQHLRLHCLCSSCHKECLIEVKRNKSAEPFPTDIKSSLKGIITSHTHQ